MLGMYDNAAFSLNYSSSDREDVKCGFLSRLANDLHSIMSNRKRENRARSLLRLFINGLYSLCPHFHAGSGCSAC